MDDKASLQKDSIKSLNPTSFYAQLWVYQTKTDFRQSLICKKGAQILKVFNSISLISYMLIVDKSNGSEDCMKHSSVFTFPGVWPCYEGCAWSQTHSVLTPTFTRTESPSTLYSATDAQWTPFHISACRFISFLLTSTEYSGLGVHFHLYNHLPLKDS